jgi:hypothetical protein
MTAYRNMSFLGEFPDSSVDLGEITESRTKMKEENGEYYSKYG